VSDARRALRYVSANAALFYHTGRFSADETRDYIATYALSTPERAAKSFSFIANPLYRSYIFTYTAGYDLLAEAGGGDKMPVFTRLLTEQVLPSALCS
jgi:hypothetical protein